MLGDKVEISRNTNKITVKAVLPFSKRYLKYLTKKFLKKQGCREYLRVLASSKNSFRLQYFNIESEEDSE